MFFFAVSSKKWRIKIKFQLFIKIFFLGCKSNNLNSFSVEPTSIYSVLGQFSDMKMVNKMIQNELASFSTWNAKYFRYHQISGFFRVCTYHLHKLFKQQNHNSTFALNLKFESFAMVLWGFELGKFPRDWLIVYLFTIFLLLTYDKAKNQKGWKNTKD